MRVICVDDEPMVLEEVKKLLNQQADVEETVGFLAPDKALEWLKTNQPDAAFLDINLGRMNGLELAKRIRELYHDCAVVFITGYSEYTVEEFLVRADGYLLKPTTAEEVLCELDNIKSKHPLAPPRSGKRIRVQCFGNFEVFCDGVPLQFERRKTKELLAYLVDRQGTSVSMSELISILWGDAPAIRSIQSNLRNSIHNLASTFAKVGADNIFIRGRNTLALNADAIDCDFYDFQRRMPYVVNLYRGEYMAQYSLAEITTSELVLDYKS